MVLIVNHGRNQGFQIVLCGQTRNSMKFTVQTIDIVTRRSHERCPMVTGHTLPGNGARILVVGTHINWFAIGKESSAICRILCAYTASCEPHSHHYHHHHHRYNSNRAGAISSNAKHFCNGFSHSGSRALVVSRPHYIDFSGW